MDPISAIGTVAASVQFADVAFRGILQTIKFLRALEGTPAKIKKLLAGVDKSIIRIVQIQRTLQKSPNHGSSLLSTAQLAALNCSLSDGLQAMNGLQTLLEPLVRAQDGQSGPRRLWNAVVARKLWPDIEEYLQDIQRQNDDILRELQLSGLDMQFWLAWVSQAPLAFVANILYRDNLGKTLSAVEQSSLNERAQIRTLQNLTEEIYEEVVNMSSRIEQIQDYSTSSVGQLGDLKMNITSIDSKLDALYITSNEVGSQMQSIRDTIIASESERTSHLRNVFEHESAKTREEIIDVVMPLILGQQSAVSSLQGSIDRLSLGNKELLGKELRRELITHPSSLKDVCDFTKRQVEQISQPRSSCSCRKQRHANIRFGFLSFQYHGRTVHRIGCPERYLPASSPSLRLALQLLPFLEKTVEVTFGATFQGGGFQVQSPLRIFTTVKRSSSELFQLFESFPDRCKAEPTGSQWLNHGWRTSRNGRFEQMFYCYTWDVNTAKIGLQQLLQALMDIRERQPYIFHQRDEQGHTVLHEIVMLIGLLGPIYSEVIEEVNSLLMMAEQSHVDVNATANSSNYIRRNQPEQIIGDAEYRPLVDYTAGDLARDFVRMYHEVLEDFSFLSRIATFCPLDVQLYEPDANHRSLPLDMRSSLLLSLQRDPWLIKYFYDDDLPGIIICQRLDDLQRLLPTIDLRQEYPWRVPLSALELAVGWPDGLRLLSRIWTHSTTAAIGLAAEHCEWESLEAICGFPLPFFTNIVELREFFKNLIRCGRVLVDVLKQRRDDLARLACRYLPPNEQAHFGLTDTATLDSQARAVYDLLQSRAIPVPISLDPGPSGSIYNFIAAVYAEPAFEFPSFNSVMLLENLFYLDFRDIDGRNSHPTGLETLQYGSLDEDELAEGPVYTAVEDILTGTTMNNSQWATIIAWFLRRGARPRWEPPGIIPNIIFGVAKSLSQYNEEQFVKYHDEKPTRLLIEYCASLVSPVETDGCDCFCSSKGCIPLKYLLHNTTFSTQYRCHLHQGYRMWYWMNACGLSDHDQEACLEEAVRYELFTRLDMAHTCCLGPRSMTARERRRIQEESGEDKAQLELLMEAYRASRDHRERWPGAPVLLSACECPADEVTWNRLVYSIGDLFHHWSSWWRKTRDILPIDLTHIAWPDVMVHRDRYHEYHSLRLRQQGYGGMDFLDVIKQHFEQDLILEELPQQQEASPTFVPRRKRHLLDEALIHACINANRPPWDWLIESWQESSGHGSNDAEEEPVEEMNSE